MERIATFHEVLDEELGEVTAGKIDTEDRMGKRETFVNGDSVGDTITRVENDTGCTTRSVERENGLDSDIESRSVKCLEHDLSHLLAIGLGVERGLREQDGMLFWCDTELIVKSMMPDLFHIVPVGDDTVLNRILECQDTTL